MLAGGSVLTSDHEGDFALARYHTDGTLDSTFGTNGSVTTDFHGGSDSAAAIAIQQDGRIVAAGFSSVSTTEFRFALARYR